MSGPLSGYMVVELAGIGPAPFAGMMLADMGADVVRIDRPGSGPSMFGATQDVLARGKRSVAIDVKTEEGRDLVLRLAAGADVLIEGFRPGVVERLGVGPDHCAPLNPRLVYGRMTGWGQEGPYSQQPGHDINYLALSGTLSLLGQVTGPPMPPVNFLADFGGGGMLLTVGVVAALLEAQRSGRGQVVDAAMIDGAGLLAAMTWAIHAAGQWGPRGSNLIDGGAWFYNVYETADHQYVSIGSIEPQFYAELLRLTGLREHLGGSLPEQLDQSSWPAIKETMASIFATKTRAEWCEYLENAGVCFAPVLTLDEVPLHPHVMQRAGTIEIDGVPQPAPAPRFSRTASTPGMPPVAAGAHTDEVLIELGIATDQLAQLRAAGVVA